MSKVKGTVSGCGKGKYSFFITLVEREGFYFNTKYEPKCGKGDVVGIEFTPKGDSRGNVQKVIILESNSNGYEDTGGSGGGKGGGSGGGSGGGNADRQDSIVWQSSRKDALVLAGLLVSNEYVKVPKGDKGRIVIEALVDEVTARFFGDASDPKKSAAYTTNVGIEEDAKPEGDDSGGDWDEKDEPKKPDSWDEWDD